MSESTAQAELDSGANPSGELSGDPALDLLLKRENERDEAQDAPEQAEEPVETAEQDVSAEVQDAPVDDPDIEFELDGKAIKVKKSELPQIYRERMLESDYRQKTAQAAELTRQAEAERTRIAQERQMGVNQLDAVLSVLHQELQGQSAHLDELLDSDPVAYMKVRREVERKEGLIRQALQQREVLTQQQEAESYRAQQDYVRAEQEKLREKLPEWRDEKVRATEAQAIAELLIAHGYAHNELELLTDHRALLLARKAMKYDQMMAVRAKQVAQPPAKPVPPGVRNPNPQVADKTAEARRKAMRNPTIDRQLDYMLSRYKD